jgi:tetratricopeptide (TPR) repeat protein
MAAKKPPKTRQSPVHDATAELARVLGSQTFRQVERLKRFLNFVVTEATSGRGDQLKEYVIGVQVFDKEPSFDPRADPIVRVQARRLRARLVRYYRDEGHEDPLVIEMPKGGYSPVFRPRAQPAEQSRTLSATLMAHNSVAVGHIADLTPGRDFGYFCDGLRQEIIHALTQCHGLRVLAWQPDDSSPDATTKGAPSAALIVSGSIRKSGHVLRISVHISSGASGSYFASESRDYPADDALAAQEGMAQLVVAKLEPELIGASDGRRGAKPADNLAARKLYLQGRYHLNQRTEEGLQKAVEFFEHSLLEDPHYAEAHSGLSDAYGLLGNYGVLGPADVWTKAASLAASAVMLDGNSAEARTTLAHVKAVQDWDWTGAEREFQLAIGLAPGYATAHHWFAMSCLVPLGRFDEALQEMLLAQSLDPVSSIVARDLAVVHLYRRDLESALEQCDHTIELNPHFSPAYWTLGLIQEQRKDLDESTAAIHRAISLAPHSPRMQAALARALALAGKRDQALTILRKLEELSKQRYVSPFDFACIRFVLNQHDLGFKWLSRAYRDRCFEMIALRFDPRVDVVRTDKRLEAIAKQMGLK